MARGDKHDLVLSRRRALILAAILSVVLFGAGLLSGLSVAKMNEQRTQLVEQRASQAEQRASLVEQTTERNLSHISSNLSSLSAYVDSLGSDLRSLQLQDAFVRSLDEKSRCAFADTYFSQVADKLNYYWAALPYRLEQYEQGRNLSPDYLRLKSEYTKLSLEAWMIARDNRAKCNTTAVPILYFYAQNCTACVEQGEILDDVKGGLQARGGAALVFTVDIDQPEPALRLISRYYNVTAAPAIIVDERILQGRVASAREIEGLI